MDEKTIGLLTDYFIRENDIDTSQDYEILSVPARTLLCPNRFDLMAKWIYIDAREKGMEMEYAIRIYKDSVNAFSCGSFLEPGTDSKDSFQKYLDDFNSLIDEIKEYGFDDTKSLIPVGEDDRIFDGSHRVAVAAYYDKEVTIIRFPNKRPTYAYDYRYFRKYIMSDINMGYMAKEYTYLKENCFFACIWPSADRSKLQVAEEMLREIGSVVYEQDIYLTYEGMRNFMIQIYGLQSWVGTIEDKFSGVNYKVNPCYNSNNPVRTYLIEASNPEMIVDIKAKIRDIFGIENHSIHISDNQQETIAMAEMLFNPNSVDVMNFAKPFVFDTVFYKLKEFQEMIARNNLDRSRFIIDSSAVLEVCGLREARDIDYLTDYEDAIEAYEGIENHESQIKFHDISVADMLYNPENYFYYYGFKFLSVYRLMEMKKRRNEPKDQRDVELCKKIVKKFKNTPVQYRRETIEKINKFQIYRGDYGHGPLSYKEYKMHYWHDINEKMREVAERVVGLSRTIICLNSIQRRRARWIEKQRRKLINRDFSIIASNCNGGVLTSDLGLQFNSPFVNLFIKASDYIRILQDLKGYMKEELRFVKEDDPIYGRVSYPTAYLRDAKIYFMHYKSEEEARTAWNRRKERIKWDNLFIIFTDRSQCTQKDLEDFDKLPFQHKVVFTHIPHPEIKSSFYIKGYENEAKVPILTSYKDEERSVKRIYDQFNFVEWLNGKSE